MLDVYWTRTEPDWCDRCFMSFGDRFAHRRFWHKDVEREFFLCWECQLEVGSHRAEIYEWTPSVGRWRRKNYGGFVPHGTRSWTPPTGDREARRLRARKRRGY